MAQTMLLTKALSTFLASNTTPQLHTLLLLSPTGKLLSSSSPSPASTLRTQATLACSLWTLYHLFPTTTSPLLASSPDQSPSPALPSQQDLNSLTVQLEFGVMSIRALKAGLLFVAIGPSASSSSIHTQHSSQFLQQTPSRHTSPPGSPTALLERGHSQLSLQEGGSEAGSVGTERGGGASIWGVRRQAEDMGRYLEGALEGFVMSAAER